MTRLAILMAALALVASGCTRGPSFETSACTMQTVESAEFYRAVSDKQIVCIDDHWYVRLDDSRSYAFEDGKVEAVTLD